jgi:spermidine synthase
MPWLRLVRAEEKGYYGTRASLPWSAASSIIFFQVATGSNFATLFRMIPSHTLAEIITPEGGRLTLVEHDGSYCIRLDGRDLMHSRTSFSELYLGQLGCGRLLEVENPRILIGGLGLGFTLKGVLDHVGPGARVEVVELFREVIEWNRQFLGSLHGGLLDDPRVEVRADDVYRVLKEAERESYDAILLDIDNGPNAMVKPSNIRLYDRRGLDLLAHAVKPRGRVAIWSAARDSRFEARLKKSGLQIEPVPAKMHANAKRDAHTIYLADPFEF